ncbi:cationic amino acid transporter 4-like [Lineus longissimus]|uniref:cationic amino acid transporter 4-like n=1 Tax=Lineus longissimus TaxID=88925 RepID=UPI002B4C6800
MTSKSGEHTKCSAFCEALWHKVTRTKTLGSDLMTTPLKRCLTTLEVTFFGIGQMAGAGIYVLTGAVAKQKGGPATPLCYLIAGLVSFLSALCYAEFGARVPKAGSSYTYAYVTVGELLAFIIGWNILLEHCITTAATARAWSGSMDTLLNGAMSNGTMDAVGRINVPGFAKYPDFVATGLIILLAVLVILGAKESVTFSVVIAILNIAISVIIIGAGMSRANIANWENKDHGGFLPFGTGGLLGGAAMSVYAYTGYDAICIAGEETKNPAKSMPIANGVAMSSVMVLYILLASTLTLMIPYYQVDPDAAFTVAFKALGMPWAEILVTVGALVAITGTCLGNMFSTSRSAYAMARDGILFEIVSYVHPKTKTPIVAIIAFAVIAGTLAMVLDVGHLAEFVSIGTLVAVSVVSACVIVLRYQTLEQCQFELKVKAKPHEPGDESQQLVDEEAKFKNLGELKPRFRNVPILRDLKPGKGPVIATGVMMAFMAAFALASSFAVRNAAHVAWWSYIIMILSGVGLASSFAVICMHKQNHYFQTFQMPLVPFLPSLSMLLNIGLLMQMSWLAWVRFLIWMLIGFLIYFGYGIRHSKENISSDDQPMGPTSMEGSYQAVESSGDGTPSRPDAETKDEGSTEEKHNGNAKKTE